MGSWPCRCSLNAGTPTTMYLRGYSDPAGNHSVTSCGILWHLLLLFRWESICVQTLILAPSDKLCALWWLFQISFNYFKTGSTSSCPHPRLHTSYAAGYSSFKMFSVDSLIMGVFQCCAAVCQRFASSANVLVLLLPSRALFVAPSH